MLFLTCYSIKYLVILRVIFENFILLLIHNEITCKLLSQRSQIRFKKKGITFREMVVHPSSGESGGGTCWLGSERKTFFHRTSLSSFCKTPWLCPPWIYLFRYQMDKIPLSKMTVRPPNFWLMPTWRKESSNYGHFLCLFDDSKCSGMNVTAQAAVYVLE